MGIVQDIEKLQNEIGKTEEDAPAAEVAEEQAPVEDVPEAEQVEESADVADVQEDEKPQAEVKEEKEDNGHVFSKLRKLEREKEALLEALEREKAAARQQQAQPVQKQEPADPEPDKEADPEAWLLWENRQLRKEVSEVKQWKNQTEQERAYSETYKRAVTFLAENEREFRSTFKDPAEYDGATSHMINKMKEGVRYIYPSANEAQIAKFVETQLLSMADSFAGKGLNPSQELYSVAIEKYGYIHKPEAKEEQKKASVKDVAENKKRSITSLNGGASKERVLPTAKELTPGQLGKLSQDDLQRLFARK